MANPLLTKAYDLGAAAVAGRTIVKLSADGTVVAAAAATDALIGVTNAVAAATGERADVVQSGIADVICGGVVTRGGLLTSDASGHAVTASANDRVVGIALVSGVSGDIIPCLINVTGRITPESLAVADVTVATAAVKTLNATPVTLVAAPGSGKFIAVQDVTFFLDYASAAYDGIAAGEDLTVRYTDGSGQLIATCETTGFLDQTADQVRFVDFGAATVITPVANAAVVLHMSTGEIATGDSPLKVRVTYKVMDAAL